MEKRFIRINTILFCALFLLASFLPYSKSVFAKSDLTPINNISDSILVNKITYDSFLTGDRLNRSAYSVNEYKTAQYLADKMSSYGLNKIDKNGYDNYFQTFKGLGQYSGKTSQNVVGYKKASIDTKKQVIIYSHYDNTYSINHSYGAFDNASGCLALLSLMQATKEYNYNFNIIYIFFGAEENDLDGSTFYVNRMTYLDKQNTLCSINFDSIGVGEYLYAYEGEYQNSYKKLLSDVKNSLNYSFYTKPNDTPKNTKWSISGAFKNKAYYHIGFESDNYNFSKNGIPTLFMFSGNWEAKNKLGYAESENLKNIHHTSNDNLEYIETNYPNYLSKINSAVVLVYHFIGQQNFVDTMVSCSYEKNFDFINNKFTIFVLLIFITIIMYSFFKHFKNKIA
jgi:alkaline phosphatase isozyme conversion protein